MTKRHRPGTAIPKGGHLLDGVPLQADLDSARRLHEAVALHLAADFERAIRSCIVVGLADGRDTGTMFDTWDDACAEADRRGARWWAPMRITPDGISERDARLWMRVVRNFPGIKAVPEGVLQSAVHPAGGRKLRP